MNSTRATLAIARRHMGSHWIYAQATRIALAIVAACVISPTTNPLAVYFLALAFAALSGGELRVRDLMYFAAPLYGRQLARAHALTAVTAALAPPAAFFAVQALRGTPWPWQATLATLVACAVAALVGLSAALRGGRTPSSVTAAEAGYLTLALVAGAAIIGLYSREVPIYAWLAFALLLGFLALRAFGETLARYDPTE